MNKKILITGGILAVVAIILGAFGSHGLKETLSADSLRSFETGARYQMYHALMLLFIGNLSVLSNAQKRRIWYLVLGGVILFSGSIYLLSTEALHQIDFGAIGFVTPIGGLLLISAWIVFVLGLLRNKNH